MSLALRLLHSRFLGSLSKTIASSLQSLVFDVFSQAARFVKKAGHSGSGQDTKKVLLSMCNSVESHGARVCTFSGSQQVKITANAGARQN